MKKAALTILPVILLVAFTMVVGAPQTGHSFWYGADFNEIAEYLDNDAKDALTDVLLQDVLPSIGYW